MAFDPDDGLLVGLSTGSAFEDPVAWSDEAAWKWASWDSHPRMLGDVDGDGAADAVLMDAQVQVGLASE